MMQRKAVPLRQRGYSATELIVVVAITGMFFLISVPPFLTYMRQIRVRSATRQLNTDLRFARQRAISQGNPVAFSFTAGDVDPDESIEKARYIVYDQAGGTWAPFGQPKYLEGVYFLPSNFDKDLAIDDDDHDVIFFPNGTVQMNDPGGTALTPPLLVEIRTDMDVPNNHLTNTFYASGAFDTTLSTD